MAKTKMHVVVHRAAIRELLKDDGVVGDLEARGDRIAAAAGRGFETQTWIGKNRARVTVRTGTKKAAAREAQDHVLLRALDAGRG